MHRSRLAEVKKILDRKVEQYNCPSFIENDPISIPHNFTKKKDIEIAGLFAALFAWGQRTTIINKANDLMRRMDHAPFEFIQSHSSKDLKNLMGFKHRTFQADDLLFLVYFLKEHYKKYESLEDAFFISPASSSQDSMEQRLSNFYSYVFSFDHLKRTEKHIATPRKNSACKRLNMYLRWMVRKDKQKVDFGIWNKINPSELIIPLDVHVCRISSRLGLLDDVKSNWAVAVKLTELLRQFDSQDPVKYDFALFGMGVSEK